HRWAPAAQRWIIWVCAGSSRALDPQQSPVLPSGGSQRRGLPMTTAKRLLTAGGLLLAASLMIGASCQVATRGGGGNGGGQPAPTPTQAPVATPAPTASTPTPQLVRIEPKSCGPHTSLYIGRVRREMDAWKAEHEFLFEGSMLKWCE